MNSLSMTWLVKASREATLPFCNSNYLTKDETYLHLSEVNHVKEEKTLHLPESFNKCSGQKRPFEKMEDSIGLDDHNVQGPAIKRCRRDELLHPVNLYAWQEPVFVPILPRTGPTYIDDLPESIFLPAKSKTTPDISIDNSDLCMQHA